jgi:DNA-binding NtrC family response regulator
MKGHVLIIEDDRDMCEMLDFGLKERGFTTRSCLRGAEGLQAVGMEQPDVILTDINLPDIKGVQICQEVVAHWQEIPVVMMTAFGSMETAIESLRVGAYDFITKPLDMDILAVALERAVDHCRLKKQVKVLQAACETVTTFSGMIGASKPMKELFVRLERIADTETSILVRGESGTGKEVTARALHGQSRRSKNPFVAINCSALPEALLESELFGHVKGAFTDAWQNRKGLLREADGGTLFLDEIGDIPLALQPKLLRALEERKVRPVGGNEECSFDVRIIAATNTDLEEAIAEGRFREDLYYRLNVIRVDLPPLRQRDTDVLLLARRFIEESGQKMGKQVTGLTDSAAKKLLNYAWPGNVRELRNAMEHGVAMTLFDRIVPEDLPEKIHSATTASLLFDTKTPSELISLEEMTMRYISHVIDVANGNQSLAAQILQIDRKTIYRKLQKPLS